MNQYQQLALQLGVSLNDFMCFAQSVANSIEKDKMSKIFSESSEKERIDIVQLYAEHANKKFQSFFVKYFTNDAAKEAFVATIR